MSRTFRGLVALLVVSSPGHPAHATLAKTLRNPPRHTGFKAEVELATQPLETFVSHAQISGMNGFKTPAPSQNPVPGAMPALAPLDSVPENTALMISPLHPNRALSAVEPDPNRLPPEPQAGLTESVGGMSQVISPLVQSVTRLHLSYIGLHTIGGQLQDTISGLPASARAASAPIPSEAAWKPQDPRLLIFSPMPARPERVNSVAPPPSHRHGLSLDGYNSLSMHGLLGFLFPLNVWSQIFPYAWVGTVILALIYYDLKTGSRFLGFLRQILTRRSLAKNVEDNLTALFDIAHEDSGKETELRVFLTQWNGSSEKQKLALLQHVARGESSAPELWAQKLLMAYLLERSENVSRALKEALRSSSLNVDFPWEPVLKKFLARTGTFPWLKGEPLSRLSALADSMNPAAESSVSASGARQRPSLLARFGILLSGLALIAWLFTALASTYYKWQHDELQARSSLQARNDFWGEDAFIFNPERYQDQSLADRVLPFLEHHHKLSSQDAPQLLELIELMSRSPDSQWDNVLEAIFKKADLLPPMNAETEKLLTSTLIERKNDSIWHFMRRQLRGYVNAKTLERFQSMIQIGLAQENEESLRQILQHTFYFHKSDEEGPLGYPSGVRKLAEGAVLACLNDPSKRGLALARLDTLSLRYLADVELQLQVGRYLLDFLTQPENLEFAKDVSTARTILYRISESAEADDAWRVQAFLTLKPGEENRLAPMSQEDLWPILEAHFNRTPRATPDSPLAQAAQWQVDRSASNLVQEAQKLFPGLEARLRELRVIRLGSHRDSGYQLVHLRNLQRILGELAQKSAEQNTLTPPRREFLQRATRLTELALSLAQKAGFPDGSATGEMAAADINEFLSWVRNIFSGDDRFFEALQRAGLTAMPQAEGGPTFLPTYTREQMQRIQAIVNVFLLKNETLYDDPDHGSPQPRELYSHEQMTLSQTIEIIDHLARYYFPKPEEDATHEPSGTIGQRMQRLRELDPRVKDAAERDVRAMLKAQGKLMPARLYGAAYRHNQDPVISTWILEFLAEELRGPQADSLDAGTAKATWETSSQALSSPKQAFAVLERAIDISQEKGAKLPEKLQTFTRDRMKEAIDLLIAEAEAAYPGMDKKLAGVGVRLSGPRMMMALAPSLRSFYREKDLELFLKIVREDASQREQAGILTPEQKRVRDRVEELLLQFLRMGKKIDMPTGHSAGEQAADQVNPILYAGYHVFQYAFIQAMREQGLIPLEERSFGVASDTLFYPSYTRDMLSRFIGFLKGIGEGWESSTQRRPLKPDEMRYLQAAIPEITRIYKNYPEN